MGSLILPASGRVYVDTQIVSYGVQQHPDYFPLVRQVWQAAQAGSIKVVTSELTLLEALVLPIRSGDQMLRDQYERAITRSDLQLLPITQDILKEAALLRARHRSLRTPDAIHAATAMITKSSMFLTNDTAFRSVPALGTVVLSELI